MANLPDTGQLGPILLVEDDRPTRELLVTVLAQEGLRTVAAGNAHEAMEQARALPPTMAIVDVHLSALSGITLCTALHTEHGTQLPVLAMSAGTEERVALLAGAYDYLQKPFDLTEFLAKVGRGLALAQEAAELRPPLPDAQRALRESAERQRGLYQAALTRAPVSDTSTWSSERRAS